MEKCHGIEKEKCTHSVKISFTHPFVNLRLDFTMKKKSIILALTLKFAAMCHTKFVEYPYISCLFPLLRQYIVPAIE